MELALFILALGAAGMSFGVYDWWTRRHGVEPKTPRERTR